MATPDKPDGRLRGSAGGHQADAEVEDDPNIFSSPDLGKRNLSVALGYVADGWPIIRLAPGAKRPSKGSLGVYGATTDPAEVKRMWSAAPDANIGGATGHGFMVLDVDPDEGAAETLAALLLLPRTRRHQTPGGEHIIYRAPIDTRGGKLGPGVTVRGLGSYVVLPGSTLVNGGEYLVLDDHPPVDAPAWLLARLANHTPSGVDLPAEVLVDIDSLPKYLVEIVAEVPGVDRSGQVWNLVTAALEWGLEDGEIVYLARRFTPAVDKYGERLDQEIGRALAKERSQHRHPRVPCDRAGCPNTPDWMGGPPKTSVNRFRAGVLTFDQVLARPEPVYLVDGLVVVHTIAVLFGRSTVGKSFVALDWALTAATEGDWLGRRVEPGPVLYVASEGADGLGPRLRAWSQEHGGLIPADGAFEVYPVPVNLRDPAEVDELVAYVAERRVLLTVIDTLNRSIGGGNENAPDVMGPAFEAADRIRRAHDRSTPLVIHHANDEGRVRGHKSWEGNTQTIISARFSGGVLSLSTDPEHGGKQKDGPPVRLELELRPVALHEGGSSCVVVPSSLVKATLAELAAVLSHKLAFAALLKQRAAVGSAVTGGEATKFCVARGIAERTFRDLVAALVNEGKVHKEGRGQTALYRLLDS